MYGESGARLAIINETSNFDVAFALVEAETTCRAIVFPRRSRRRTKGRKKLATLKYAI